MEAFSLLKYWRGGGGGGGGAAIPLPPDTTTSRPTTTILTAVPQTDNATESDDEDDHGPFFDLEFTVPDEDSEDNHENTNPNYNQQQEQEADDDINTEEESDGDSREFKFTLSPSSNDRSDPNLSLSPSEDLFFNENLVQVEPSSFVLNSSEPNSKPQFTASLLKSATKLRVFMLGLKKSKSNVSDSAASNPDQPESQKKQPEKKLFTVKFKVEEVPIVSLFTRENSSRGNKSQPQNQNQNQKNNNEESSLSSEEKRFSKEVMHKYLKMVKPLYIRVSRRYGEKIAQLNLSSGGKTAPVPPEKKACPAEGETVVTAETAGTNVKTQKQGNLPAGLRVVCKHFGKSRSASSAVAAAPPLALSSSKRRDDSLLQQQDGIQGAILHCKRSFNASRECESSQLPRSVSDPLHEIPCELSRKSTNEGKDKQCISQSHQV